MVLKNIQKHIALFKNYLIYKKIDILSKLAQSSISKNENADFVVSIASYPKRDHLLPAVFQALSRQTVLPKKWILVLSEEDYESGIPAHLHKLVKRGLEIIWVKDNPYAVKKLLPVIEKYPDLAVVTLDDDIIYHPSLLHRLINHVLKYPGSIVGYVGKPLLKKDNKLHIYFREKKSATNSTNPEQVYLIGWGGIYYPVNSLDSKVLNMDAVHRIVPGRGSDIWFWAAAHAKNTQQRAIGLPNKYNLGIPIPQNNNTKPKDTPGADEMDKRFSKAIDYFGIREKLLNELPDLNEVKS